MRCIDFTTLCTSVPAVLPDGSILCTHGECQDKNIFSWQSLWTIHPDGRQLQPYFGNTFTVPNSHYDGTRTMVFARPVENFFYRHRASRRVRMD